MATKPKPGKTRHRDLNDAAIGKLQVARRKMITLVRHIQPRDEAGMTTAEEITDLFLSALADLEEERRILDGGVDVAGLEQYIVALSQKDSRTEQEISEMRGLIQTIALRQELLAAQLGAVTGVPVELPKLKNSKRDSQQR